MSRLVSPDGKCVGVDVGGRRYNGTIVEPVSREHARLLREVGYFPASAGGVPRSRGGFDCSCGFRAYFARCSRCGRHRDDPVTEPVDGPDVSGALVDAEPLT